MRRQRRSCLVNLMIVLFLSGCAQPPVQQLEAAQKAVEAARAVGAPDYAKEEFGKLEQAFSQAREELANQEKTFAIFRSYSTADRMLKQVMEDAKRVEDTATSKKEEARTAALKIEKEAQTVLASAQELLAKAPVGKGRTAVESIKNDLQGAQASLEAVHQLIEKGDYLSAEERAKEIKEKGNTISTEIQHAIEKIKGANRRRA